MLEIQPNYTALTPDEASFVIDNRAAMQNELADIIAATPHRYPVVVTTRTLPTYLPPTEPPADGPGAWLIRVAIAALSGPI